MPAGVSISVTRRHRPAPFMPEPLTPKRRWQTITVGTLMLVPAYWAMLAGMVSAASDKTGGPDTGASLALGLGIVPFVFIVVAVMSGQPRWPSSVLKAMGLALLVGIPASALAGDAVTGIVAGIGAGGIAALRGDPDHGWRTRAAAVAFAAVYTFVLVRVGSVLVLLPAPIFPLTAVGLADHWAERRARS